MRFESDREEAKSPIIMLVEVGLFVAAAILAIAGATIAMHYLGLLAERRAGQ